MTPHIGLNVAWLTPGAQGGLEVYSRELIARLARRSDIRLTVLAGRAAAELDWWGLDVVRLPMTAARRWQWVGGEQTLVPAAAVRAGCDVVHSLASTAPLVGPFRRVTTVHDLNYRMVKGAHRGATNRVMAVLVRSAVRRSHTVIADSQTTADDLHRELHCPADKISVIPLGVTPPPEDGQRGNGPQPTDIAALRSDLRIGQRPVILCIAAKRPSKNLVRLIEAHALLNAPRPVLVLAGYSTPYEDEMQRAVTIGGTAEDVRMPGWVSDADREALYAMADVFAFPSLYEGFGLPPLEAMLRGVPVLTSTRGSLREVVGDAALLVDPTSVQEIHQGLHRLMHDTPLRVRLSAAGLAQARLYTWDATAEATIRAYRTTLQMRADSQAGPT